jgi:acetyl-CoA C-acetyltransferase
MTFHSHSPKHTRPRAQVIGQGQTRFGRAEDRTLIDLASAAGSDALDSAGLAATDVDALFFGTFAGLALGGQAFPAAVLAARLGLGDIPALAVEGACASGSLAFRQAVSAIEAGTVDVALVVGAEKMTGRSTAEVTGVLARANDTGSDSYDAELTFPGFFALVAQRYLHEYGVDRDLLAEVSVKNRANGASNPKAQFQKPITRQEALGARAIADPLRLFDCSAISDGGAALVVASREWATAHGAETPVDVLSVAQSGGPVSPEQMTTFVSLPAAVTAAQVAYSTAAIAPEDVDVVEVHDCFTVAEWVALEDLGLIARGEAAASTAEGVTRVGGALPVNPSGGLLAKGHPIGATGVAQIIEIVRQLRGEAHNQVEDARVGLAHNVGGTGGVAVVTVMERAR